MLKHRVCAVRVHSKRILGYFTVIPKAAVLARPAEALTTWYTCIFFLGKIGYSLIKVQFTHRIGYTPMQGASAMQTYSKEWACIRLSRCSPRVSLACHLEHPYNTPNLALHFLIDYVRALFRVYKVGRIDVICTLFGEVCMMQIFTTHRQKMKFLQRAGKFW